ncbi:MAG: hypothetical protein HY825_02975 [Acidobacteria bacterium]|nr:hypothetical protein [Acidobacteriota bacterium]
MHEDGVLAAAIRARNRALGRFADWGAANPCRLQPAAAVAGVATLYELTPTNSRRRPVDTDGIRACHRALAKAGRR